MSKWRTFGFHVAIALWILSSLQLNYLLPLKYRAELTVTYYFCTAFFRNTLISLRTRRVFCVGSFVKVLYYYFFIVSLSYYLQRYFMSYILKICVKMYSCAHNDRDSELLSSKSLRPKAHLLFPVAAAASLYVMFTWFPHGTNCDVFIGRDGCSQRESLRDEPIKIESMPCVTSYRVRADGKCRLSRTYCVLNKSPLPRETRGNYEKMLWYFPLFCSTLL